MTVKLVPRWLLYLACTGMEAGGAVGWGLAFMHQGDSAWVIPCVLGATSLIPGGMLGAMLVHSRDVDSRSTAPRKAHRRPRKTISYDEMEIEVAKDQFVNGETTFEEFEQFVAARLRNPLAPEREHGPDQPELTWHHDRRSGMLVIHFTSHHNTIITITKDPKQRSLFPGSATTERQVLDWARRTEAPNPPPGTPRIVATSGGDPLGKPEWSEIARLCLSTLAGSWTSVLFVIIAIGAAVIPWLPALAGPLAVVDTILVAIWVIWAA